MKQLPILTDEDYERGEEIWGFSSKYLVHRYDEPKKIPLVHLEWWALFSSDHKQVAIAAPREHAKSSSLTFAYLLFVLLKRQFSHVLLLGSNEKLASNFLNDIKIELLENDELVADYGVKKLLKDTETELICQFKDGHKFRLLAKGAGQRMRGIKWERKRPDLIVFDDIEDDVGFLSCPCAGQRRRRPQRYGARLLRVCLECQRHRLPCEAGQIHRALCPSLLVGMGLLEQGLGLTAVRPCPDPEGYRGIVPQYPKTYVEAASFGHPHPVLDPSWRMGVEGAPMSLVADLRSHPHGRSGVVRLLRDNAHRQKVDARRLINSEP